MTAFRLNGPPAGVVKVWPTLLSVKFPPLLGWVPLVSLADEAIGRLMAEALLDLGHRRLGFFGCRAVWSRRRESAFRRAAAAAGATVTATVTGEARTGRRPGFGPLHDARYARRFLARLPAPAGVAACNDEFAARLADAADAVGRRVPDDLAVLGADDDELHCTFARVPLSSVNPDLEAAGAAAALLLGRLLDGERDVGDVTVRPRGVSARRSTDALAFADPAMTRAVAFARRHACDPPPAIGVDDLADAADLSRRSLEMRFRRHLGRTPGAELRRVRLARAEELLGRASLPLAEVAAACGLASADYLIRAFARSHAGTTPAAWRAARRDGGRLTGS